MGGASKEPTDRRGLETELGPLLEEEVETVSMDQVGVELRVIRGVILTVLAAVGTKVLIECKVGTEVVLEDGHRPLFDEGIIGTVYQIASSLTFSRIFHKHSRFQLVMCLISDVPPIPLLL